MNRLLLSPCQVTITDFGLARQRNTGNTLMQSSVGTLSYSCPEIIESKPYNEKSDIWSIGCLLYQMATLSPPFPTSNMLALAKNIVEGRFKPLPDTCSPMLRETVARCLTADPSGRPDIIEVGSNGDISPDLQKSRVTPFRFQNVIIFVFFLSDLRSASSLGLQS
jgi:NIMA (never in mitosis gene a)-related kinase